MSAILSYAAANKFLSAATLKTLVRVLYSSSTVRDKAEIVNPSVACVESGDHTPVKVFPASRATKCIVSSTPVPKVAVIAEFWKTFWSRVAIIVRLAVELNAEPSTASLTLIAVTVGPARLVTLIGDTTRSRPAIKP